MNIKSMPESSQIDRVTQLSKVDVSARKRSESKSVNSADKASTSVLARLVSAEIRRSHDEAAASGGAVKQSNAQLQAVGDLDTASLPDAVIDSIFQRMMLVSG